MPRSYTKKKRTSIHLLHEIVKDDDWTLLLLLIANPRDLHSASCVQINADGGSMMVTTPLERIKADIVYHFSFCDTKGSHVHVYKKKMLSQVGYAMISRVAKHTFQR